MIHLVFLLLNFVTLCMFKVVEPGFEAKLRYMT